MANTRGSPVDLDGLVQAMDDFSRDINDYWLDGETGKVECVPVHMLEEMEADGEIDEGDLPDWEREFVPLARAIAAEDARYARVPESDSHEAYRLMQDFIGEVEEASRRLWRAIDGRGAFRMFKDTLYDYPKLRERWFEFEAERKREWAREWLEVGTIDRALHRKGKKGGIDPATAAKACFPFRKQVEFTPGGGWEIQRD